MNMLGYSIKIKKGYKSQTIGLIILCVWFSFILIYSSIISLIEGIEMVHISKVYLFSFILLLIIFNINTIEDGVIIKKEILDNEKQIISMIITDLKLKTGICNYGKKRVK